MFARQATCEDERPTEQVLINPGQSKKKCKILSPDKDARGK